MPTKLEATAAAYIETIPSASSPVVADHFWQVLDEAERRVAAGDSIRPLHLEEALKASTHPKIAKLVENMAEDYFWEPALTHREASPASDASELPALVSSRSEAFSGWGRAVELVEGLLRATGACPPVEHHSIPAYAALRGADDTVRSAVLEVLLCRLERHENFEQRYGKYAERALRRLISELLDDARLQYPWDYAGRLFSARQHLPSRVLGLLGRLVDTDGISVETAKAIVAVVDEATTVIDETEWVDDDADSDQDLSEEQREDKYGDGERGHGALSALVGDWTVYGRFGPDLHPDLVRIRDRAMAVLEQHPS